MGSENCKTKTWHPYLAQGFALGPSCNAEPSPYSRGFPAISKAAAAMTVARTVRGLRAELRVRIDDDIAYRPMPASRFRRCLWDAILMD